MYLEAGNTDCRWPNAVWAWEFLRRNHSYRREFQAHQTKAPKLFELESGSRMIVGKGRYKRARAWGLLFFANPKLTAYEAGVFWKPSVFPGTIPVTLRDASRAASRERHVKMSACDRVILSSLWCRRLIFESINQSRHVILAPHKYWIQLYCDSAHPLDDNALISFRIDGAEHAEKRIESVRQLLKLHRSSGRKLSSISYRRGSEKLSSAITALDVAKEGGTYKDIASALFGRKLVEESWSGGHSPFKQKARRALERGRIYRDGKYLELLT